ncbi:MAG: pyridoxamine 5'-phosphate oxidase family protein [Burkholderiales bacterium]|nr:pyridoxamine 5'-phosphate oxidase family protein [Burkholderiales bacterium]
MTTSDTFPQTELTRVRRTAKRASYERDTVHGVVDSTYVCQIAFAIDDQPHCIPTAHWRIGDTLYIHGSNGSRMLRALGEGVPACVCVAQVDGLVLARSAFHHSMNYRSAMIYGRFRVVEDDDEKWASMVAFMDKMQRDRWAQVREPNEKEFAATTFLALTIEEAVAKVRTGPPIDDEEDLGIPVWAGVLPLVTSFGEPVQDMAHVATTA